MKLFFTDTTTSHIYTYVGSRMAASASHLKLLTLSFDSIILCIKDLPIDKHNYHFRRLHDILTLLISLCFTLHSLGQNEVG
jgi:hypothetical protein